MGGGPQKPFTQFRFKAVMHRHNKADNRDSKGDAEDRNPGRNRGKKTAGAQVPPGYEAFVIHVCLFAKFNLLGIGESNFFRFLKGLAGRRICNRITG